MTDRPEADLAAAKAALRRQMRARRLDLPAQARARAHDAAADHLEQSDLLPADAAIVAGYWAMAEEFDVRPLLHRLVARNLTVVLPVVVGRDQPLAFRRWTPDMAMSLDSFGVAVPPADAPVVSPTLLLVPLLAFDRSGYRLGYGGGYYDRTLAALRATAPAPPAVGMAYAAQEVASVPHDGFDQRLDWIVTEAGAVCTGGGRESE